MNLEDHLGDIIRKARRAAQVPSSVAAAAADLSEAELTALEDSGHLRTRANLVRLAGVLGLDGDKLLEIAAGWHPAPQDLGRWRHLAVVSTVEAGNAVQAYLVWDERSRQAALFDTGWQAEPVLALLREHHLSLRYLLVTHTHHDHIAGLEALREAFPAALVHVGPGPLASSAPPAEDGLPLGNLRITHRAINGHATDGVIYLVRGWVPTAPLVAVVGDTLFAGSLANGFVSWEALRRQVLEHLLALPPETLLCPGHGPVTTVGEETRYNPFFTEESASAGRTG